MHNTGVALNFHAVKSQVSTHLRQLVLIFFITLSYLLLFINGRVIFGSELRWITKLLHFTDQLVSASFYRHAGAVKTKRKEAFFPLKYPIQVISVLHIYINDTIQFHVSNELNNTQNNKFTLCTPQWLPKPH